MSKEIDWEQRAKNAEAELEKLRTHGTKELKHNIITGGILIMMLLAFSYAIWHLYNGWCRVGITDCATRISKSISDGNLGKDVLAQVGSMGDSYGGLNTLFTGLGVAVSLVAFVAFLLALWMQRKDLSYQAAAIRQQNEELRMQRDEMKESRREMEAQTQAMMGQLSLQKEIRAEEQIRYATERTHILHGEEVDKVYSLVETFVSRIHNFSFVDANGRADGECAFEKLSFRIDAFLKYLQIYADDRGDLAAKIEELYAICSKISSVECAFIRALRCILFETQNVSEQERDEMVAFLYMSRVGNANLMLHIATQGNPFYPSENQYVNQFSNILNNSYSPIYPQTVVTAFLYILKQRYTPNRNCKNIAAQAEYMLRAPVEE